MKQAHVPIQRNVMLYPAGGAVVGCRMLSPAKMLQLYQVNISRYSIPPPPHSVYIFGGCLRSLFERRGVNVNDLRLETYCFCRSSLVFGNFDRPALTESDMFIEGAVD